MWRVPASAPEFVNPVPPAEISGWSRALASTFLHNPDDPDRERRVDLLTREWEPERAWGVRDRGRWVATLRSERRALTVPGPHAGTRELPAHASPTSRSQPRTAAGA
jgi:hypothetical protein